MLPSPVTLDERFSLPSQSLRLEEAENVEGDGSDVRIEIEIYMDCCGKVVNKRKECQEAGTNTWKELKF